MDVTFFSISCFFYQFSPYRQIEIRYVAIKSANFSPLAYTPFYFSKNTPYKTSKLLVDTVN